MLLIYFSYCIRKELADSNHGVYGVLHKEEKEREEQGWESRACPTSVAVAGAAGSLMNQPFFHKNAVRVQASIKVLLSSMVVMGVLLCSPVHTTQRKRLALLRPLLPHFTVGSEVSRVVCTGWGPTYFTSTESTQKQLATPKLEAHRVLSQTKGTKKCLQNNFTFRFIWILHTFDWTSYIIHFYFRSIFNGKDHSKTKLKSCFLKMSKRKDLSVTRWNIPTMLKLNSWHFEALPIFFLQLKLNSLQTGEISLWHWTY